MTSIGLFLMAAALTAALCLFAVPLARVLSVMDMPSGEGGHKRHSSPTPAVGGVILAIVGGAIGLGSVPWILPLSGRDQFIWLVPLAFVLATMVVGFLDDRRHIPAASRLVLGFVLSGALLFLVPELQVQRLAFGPTGFEIAVGWFAPPFTVLCLLVLQNAVNMADGRNGLILGMSMIWCVFFMFHMPPPMLPATWGVLACLLVLFFFNWRGRLFMGDCGSYGLASFFGLIALALHGSAFGTVRTAEVVLLFLIPALDLLRLIMVRLANGRSPMAPDGQHLHHLLDRVIGWNAGWLAYMTLMAVPVIVYQFLPGHGVGIILAACVAYALLVWNCLPVGRPSPADLSRQPG